MAPTAVAEAVERAGATTRGEGPVLRAAGAADLDPVRRLLEDAGLPTAGVADPVTRLVVAEEDGALVGVAGLEVHGRNGVLRSVAVDPSMRGRGLGRRLTDRVLETARESGLRRIYLLTTTAEKYFPRLGFRRADRDGAPDEVRRSVEFREACPASAVAMVLDLEEGA